MHIDILRDDASFAGLAAEWNRLLAGSVSDVPFLRHEYLAAWWSTRGGGEWTGGELHLVVARDDAGRLRGIAPLFRIGDTPDVSTLRLLGSREVSDYLDLIVHVDHHETFTDELLTRLEGEPWRDLELDNVLESSPTLSLIEGGAKRRGWLALRRRGKASPLVSLDGGWDGYLGRLAGKQRHELRRKMRKAHAYPSGIEVRVAREPDQVASEVEPFLDLMALDPAKEVFLTPPMRAYFQRLALAGAQAGWLQLAVLLAGGQRAAGYFNFAYRNRLWVYNSGLDPDFLTLSPGWVLMGHLIEAAASEGMEAVDLLRGEEPYKAQLGGVSRYVEHLTVRR